MKNLSFNKIILLVLIAALCIVMYNKLENKSDKGIVVNSEKEKVEITICSSWSGVDTKAIALEKVLKDFEKENPEIKVVNRSRSNDNFLFTLKTDFAQGNEPDIFGLWPGSDIVKLIKADKVADLTPILKMDKEWMDSFKEGNFKYDTYNNRIYGLPLEIIYEGLFINKDIFEKYNVKIPTTYEELKEAVLKLKNNGVIPIAYNCTPEGTFLYQNIVMKLGGIKEVENPIKAGKIAPCFTEAMKYMKELYSLGAFSSNAFTLDDKARNQLFLDKKAAMIVQGSWFIGEGAVDKKDRTVELIPFPSFKQGEVNSSSIIYGVGNGNFHMSKKAYDNEEKRQACIKLMKYITSKEVANKLINSTGSICNINGSEEKAKESLFINRDDMVEKASELIGPPDSFIERTFWENVLVKKTPQVLEGTIEPEDIFKEME